ncbi:beta-hydroxyacid dehydrogenase, 3-hydroxyisobutyrate dehydrogenase [Bradyrhizobium sp. YR681]|uniref:NAD(P)-dependent oxidoreductase n=1 Tax=Bradyrhizobium sp. YR681 TaxID=1144344 RepID=UPI00026F5AB5|nr:NAD(P)-dependent oxidoreductase [Bradyrhizobium sp. YR681]EJN07266.1 beta-hydroxyacid dehydrogenase, 3-hydroxyisobutyrate dehydrogenase [Bradyrhizobium sp. YR681]
MSAAQTIGFIGLGVMGGPMCRNMAKKHAGRVLILDRDPAAIAALSDTKAEAAASLEALAAVADVIFLSLPGGPQVEALSSAIAQVARPGATIVDLSTTPVALARGVSEHLKARGFAFADAPVARTREAAQRGELSIMVGAEEAVFARIKPLLDYIGSDVTHCGEVGCGQVVKLINNALVFEHTLALAEMMVVGERAGVKSETLLSAVSKGSGDSFVLRNHGAKAMLPRNFPAKAFPPEYVLKDLDYVLQLASDNGVRPGVAELARRYYNAACRHGLSGRYFPGVIEFIEQGGVPDEGQG